MNVYLKNFLHRGAIFGGFGPIILGIVYFILSLTLDDFSLEGKEVLAGIVSTYLLAFVHAGASVFNQIEHWSLSKSMFFHLSILYIAYTVCYLINSWIPFDWKILLIYTGIFIAVYVAIWVTVFISVKLTQNKLNKRLH